MYAYNRTHVTACIVLMTAICGHAVGGEINPPPGPIAPTMKSLDRVEPRVCVNDLPGDQGAMHVITKPGNYYLAGDITVETGKSGIVCALDKDSDDDGISIEMNGFSISGLPGSRHGIECPATPDARIERFNVKQEFGQNSGTRRCGGDGVFVTGADDVSISISSEDNGGAGIRAGGTVKFKAGADLSKKVNIANNGGGGGGAGGAGGGILIDGCPDTDIIGVDASRNFGTGISISFSVPEQWVKNVNLHDVRASNNMGDGVVINHMVPDDMAISIRRASMDANTGDGLRIMGVGEESMDMDMSIDELSVGHNGGYGANIHAIAAPTMRISVTDSNFATNVLAGLRCFGEEGARIQHLRATRCSSSANGGSGFEVLADGGAFDRCIASENSVHGFDTDGAPDTMGTSTKKGYDYYASKSDANAGNGIDADNSIITATVCHLISNGGNGGDFTNGSASIFDSVIEDNSGSGLRTMENPLHTESTTCAENVLYGVHSTNASGMGTTITINDCIIRGNDSGGARVENGELCGETNHFIANGGGGGGAGLEAIDVESVHLTNINATGNTGAGVKIDNSPGGSPPHALTLDSIRSSGNGGSGILVAQAAFGQIDRCVTNNNGGEGINCPASTTDMVIQRCVSSGNAFHGFNLSGFGHILVDNAAAGNVAGAIKAMVPGNTLGPNVDEAGVSSNDNPGVNYVR